jgi:hypothetical protein
MTQFDIQTKGILTWTPSMLTSEFSFVCIDWSWTQRFDAAVPVVRTVACRIVGLLRFARHDVQSGRCAESVLPTQLDLCIAWARQECLCAVLVDGFQADSSWQLAIAVSAVRSRSTHVVNLLVKFGHC